jgi:hypothetical protein
MKSLFKPEIAPKLGSENRLGNNVYYQITIINKRMWLSPKNVKENEHS